MFPAAETEAACRFYTLVPFAETEALNKLVVVFYTRCGKSMSLTVNLNETRFSLSFSLMSPDSKRQMFPAKGR